MPATAAWGSFAGLPARFWARIELAESGCWEWRGALFKQTGYGQVSVGGREGGPTTIHRVVWAAFHGREPAADLQVDHLCRNRACCNPAHLEEVTRAENVRRGLSPVQLRARHAARTTCPRGHPYTLTRKIGNRVVRCCKPCRQRTSP